MPTMGGLRFCEIDEHRFVDDLADCTAVFCAAGNQLLGESIYLGKPVLALPEPLHHEQLINSYFLRKMAVGDFATLNEVTPRLLRAFLERTPEFRRELERYRGVWNGTPTAVAAIRARLTQIPVGKSSPQPVVAEETTGTRRNAA
jgi:UDP:flavonoid glycosyltransferase YjiC (YdhE family)